MSVSKKAAALAYFRGRATLAAEHGDDDELQRFAALADRVEGELRQAECCRRCGRRLSDPASVALGIGPDCATRQRP